MIPPIATPQQCQAARREMVRLMEQGVSAREARISSAVPMHRTTVYRLLKRVQSEGERALTDGRHGHPGKLRGDILTVLIESCQASPSVSSPAVQCRLAERFGLSISECEVLRELEYLAAKERTMYELDNRKDQVMTVFKVALANLAMWVRDQYFPASYAHATWHRLLPFFQLPGTITCDATTIRVELSPFNDRTLNRDLALLCKRVNQASPRLPAGLLP